MTNVSLKSQLTDTADERLQAKMIMYKNIMSQFEFQSQNMHLQITPQQTSVSPLKFAPYDKNIYDVEPFDVSPYYTPLGTLRTVRMLEQAQKLRGYNLPQGRYRYKINLDSVIITQDPNSWLTQRNEVVIPSTLVVGENNKEIVRTYDIENVYGDVPGTSGIEQSVNYIIFKESLKKQVGQPLFIKLRNISGEHYDFIAQPSGTGSTLAVTGQSIITEKLDVNEFQVEFGHLIFSGSDGEYTNKQFDPNGILDEKFVKIPGYSGSVNQNIDTYQTSTFLDYNQEHYNTLAIQTPVNYNVGNQFVFPCGRSPAQEREKVNYGVPILVTPTEVMLRTSPLFYNQQASNITMKFSVSVISLF